MHRRIRRLPRAGQLLAQQVSQFTFRSRPFHQGARSSYFSTLPDGFTGNVCLKLLEGTISTILEGIRDEIRSSTRGKVGGLLIRPAARHLRERLDPDTYGGAYLLGLRGLAVIAHGSSSPTAIANAIRLAARGVEHRVVERLAERLRGAVLASAPPETATRQ